MTKQDFDIQKEIGRPYYWSLQTHIKAIVQMICADEIQIALRMCDEVPGYFRDNPPKELAEIKKTIYRQCYDQFDYASDHEESSYSKEAALEQYLSNYTYPRAHIITEEVKRLNAEGKRPWIFEISPSHGWLALGLDRDEHKFNFFGKNLNQKALLRFKEWLRPGIWEEKPLPDQPKILVCFEALEHCWNPHDIIQSAYKTGIEFDQIYLSTPMNCLMGGLPDWDTRRLGHVRNWTAREFLEWASKGFPGFQWKLYPHHSQVLVGVRV